jgi:hypothetical protein
LAQEGTPTHTSPFGVPTFGSPPYGPWGFGGMNLTGLQFGQHYQLMLWLRDVNGAEASMRRFQKDFVVLAN